MPSDGFSPETSVAAAAADTRAGTKRMRLRPIGKVSQGGAVKVGFAMCWAGQGEQMAPLQEGESGLCSPWKWDEGSLDSPDGAVNNPARLPLADSSCFRR